MLNDANLVCIHYDYERKECKALDKRNCINCSFFTTAPQAAERRAASAERLRSLPPKKQAEIAEKYYGGIVRWAKENVGTATVAE